MSLGEIPDCPLIIMGRLGLPLHVPDLLLIKANLLKAKGHLETLQHSKPHKSNQILCKKGGLIKQT